MIDVAILMLVVDRHIVNAPLLMEKCHEYYPEFPIYILDNTLREHDPFPEYVTVFKNETDNKTTAWSRKLLVEKVNNEFIWFIDDDDDINKFDCSTLSDEYDIHNFGFIQVKEDESGNKVTSKGNTTIPLWASFLRTDLVKRAQEPIDISIEAVCNEDDYITKIVYKLTDKIQYHNYDYIYISNVFASNSFMDSYEGEGYRKFVTVLGGRKDIQRLVDENWSDLGIEFNDEFYVIKMFRTKGLHMKELLVEVLFEAGLDSYELYKNTFEKYKGELRCDLLAETVVLLKNLFEDFTIEPVLVRKYETEERIDEFGRTITVLTKEWYEEEYPDYEGEVEL